MRAAPLLLLCLTACSTPAPELVEVSPPSDTRDAIGPYEVSAVTRGVVERVEIVLGGEGSAIRMRAVGEGNWRGVVPGVERGTRVSFQVRAKGPGGRDVRPTKGQFSFRVLNAAGVCIVDGDCLPAEICDRFENRCQVPPEVCRDDGGCGMDYVCGQDGRCRFRPEACREDAECGVGRQCREGVCEDRPECAEDGDCPDGRCLIPPGRCVADDQCLSNDDCPPDAPRCTEGQCVPDEECPGGCLESQRCERGICVDTTACGGCPAGTRCLEELDRCVECGADGECGDGHCNTSTFTCERDPRGIPCTPCAARSDCGVGTACSDAFLCAPLCERPGGLCPDGLVCSGETCISEDPNGCSANECSADAQCDSGVCNGGVCEARQYCRGGRDCGLGRRCADGRCAWTGGPCTSAQGCGRGQVCVAGHCRDEPGGRMCNACESVADCEVTAFCVDNQGLGDDTRCIAWCGDGAPCTEGYQCELYADFGVCLPENAEFLCPAGCPVDDQEPNDSQDDATRVSSGQDLRGIACPEDPDFFRLARDVASLSINVSAPAVAVLFAEGAAPITVRLFPDAETRIRRAQDQDVVLIRADVGEVSYSLRAEGLPAEECDDDNLEDNDGPQQGTRIRTGANLGGRVCGGDQDWFDVRMDAGQSGVLQVQTGDPGLNWALRTGGGTLRGGGQIRDAFELPLAFSPDGWRFGLFCEGACPPTGARYRLITDFESEAVCDDDALEPNDNRMEASEIRRPFEAELTVCERRPDWFVVEKGRGRMTITVRFDHDLGDIDLSVQAERGDFQDQSTGVGDSESVGLGDQVAAGRYFIQVYVLGQSNDYTIEID